MTLPESISLDDDLETSPPDAVVPSSASSGRYRSIRLARIWAQPAVPMHSTTPPQSLSCH